MKKLLFCALAFSSCYYSSGQLIDFEDGENGESVGSIVDPTGCDVVTFSSGSPDGSGGFQIDGPAHYAIAGSRWISPNVHAFLGPVASTNSNCGVNSATNVNMMNANQNLGNVDFGCKFIAPHKDNANACLIIDYANTTQQASGYIIDIEPRPTFDEAFTVYAFSGTPGSYTEINALRQIFYCNTGTAGDGNAQFFSVDATGTGQNISRIVIQHTPMNRNTQTPYNGGGTPVAGIAFDNFSTCTINTGETNCCGQGSKVSLVNFKSTSVWGSSYTDASGSAVLPGSYDVINESEASANCSNWNTNSVYCSTDPADVFMAINGRTGGTGKAEVFNHSSFFNSAGDYTYCMDFRRLENCCFDVLPPHITVEVLVNGQVIKTEDYDITTDQSQSCDWQRENISFSVSSSSSSIQLRVLLDETPVQDGNDFAISRVALERINGGLASNAAEFSTGAKILYPTTYAWDYVDWAGNITLEEDCYFMWSIWEIDPNTGLPDPSTLQQGNDATGWPLTGNNFAGYNGGVNEGLFDKTIDYRVELEITCPCTGNDIGYETFEHGESVDEGGDQSALNTSYKGILQDAISIFPNPSSGILQVSFDFPSELVNTLQVIDESGKIVKSLSKDEVFSGMNLDLSIVEKGNYLLRVDTKEGANTIKFVLK